MGLWNVIVDGLANAAKDAAQADDDVVLDGFARSVQLDRHSCGAHVTFAVLRYFGKARSIERTTALLGTNEDGTNWTAMCRLLRRRGLTVGIRTSATKGVLQAAIDDGCPVIVAVDDGDHWSCVYGYGVDRVCLADPAVRQWMRQDWSTFKRRWDGWGAIVSRR